MKYREFGKSGLKVSEIGFGSWAIGGNEHGNSYGFTDDKVSLDAINKALECGCNYFDTADVYGWGHSEELLGKAAKNRRDHLIIATKVGGDFYQGNGFQTFTEEYIRFALDKSLTRLRTDYIDVYQLHNPPAQLLSQPETYAIFDELKRDGKIRAWGVSIFDAREGLIVLKNGNPDSLQIPYNIFNTKPAVELFPKANAAGCAIIAREPLANGFLSGKYLPNAEFENSDMRHSWPREYIVARAYASQKLKFLANERRSLAQSALQFVLQNDLVSTAICGMKTPEQVDENTSASDVVSLTAGEMEQIRELQLKGFRN